MKKTITCDGCEACSYTSYMFTEIAGIYPITPASPMSEHVDEWSNKGVKNLFNQKVKVIEMQSEAGAIGTVHGALQSGCLATTYTASQGLLLMIPSMYKIAGEMLPGVIHVAARSLATHALSILGDHQDIYAARSTGFAYLASSSVQDAAYLSAISHLSSIESSIPFLHFFDGFRTSHEIQKIEVLEKEDYEKILNKEALNKFRNRALNKNKITRGVAENDDIYFQMTESRNKFYNNVPDIVNNYMEKLNKIAGTNYKPFNYYGSKTAKKLIIAMGSVNETIKEVIDNLDEELGLVEVHLYRPFSKEYLIKEIPKTVEKIAVLDRTKEPGSIGEPLYLDVKEVLSEKNIKIVGGRYGLSSKNTTPTHIKAVYDMLDNPVNNFTIGITDDVTNLSLEIKNELKIDDKLEFLIYGYASDGMVSASKTLIKLIGNNTDNYVQGYFEYDSKKSGGVTISNLRFSKNKIKSTYYVENPSLVVITKDEYLNNFDTLSKLKENGILILNTIKTKEELLEYLSNDIKQIIVEKNIKVYVINAHLLAHKLGLDNKISTIMLSVILKLSSLMDYEEALELVKKEVKKIYSKKGKEVEEANIKALTLSLEYLEEIKIENYKKPEIENKKLTILETINKRKGNELPVSAFINNPDGTFEKEPLEHNSISNIVPSWISENCIQCNQCSFVCPHSVIRPYLLTEEEYNKAPDYIKNRCVKEIGRSDYYYIIGISIKNCTGCYLCIKNCPAKEKALIKQKINEELINKEQKIFDYLDKNIKEKDKYNINTIKGSQFVKPNFEFSGACSGCGETTYIKLLTQVLKGNLIIANATGCSSIYGGSLPNLPYNIPWINSLFEDNAEFGYGILSATNYSRNKIKTIMENNLDNPNKEIFKKWLENYDDIEKTTEVYNELDYETCPQELVELKDYIIKKNIWAIGGDGWAYDIGFSGIDHVLSRKDNINILVLDTEVYSNTGGQASKSTPIGSIASFASHGKNTNKKDLARIALSYPHVYVAQISLANKNQVLKVLKEANDYNGPSIVIAYSPCISHGIKGGMTNSLYIEELAIKSGFYPIFHYNPIEEKLYLDNKNVDFNLHKEFIDNQTRFSMLDKISPNKKEELLKELIEHSKKRFNYYKDLSEK